MRMRGEDAVCVTAIGEGSTSGGDFHEALNFAATHKLAVVFVVENNGYAISVPVEKQMATPNVSDRALAYGIPGVSVDGNDAIACYRVARDAMQRARAGEGPTLLEAKVHRLTSHSSTTTSAATAAPRSSRPSAARTACRTSAPCSRTSACSRRATPTPCAPSWWPSSTRRPRTPSRPPDPSADTALLHVYAEDE